MTVTERSWMRRLAATQLRRPREHLVAHSGLAQLAGSIGRGGLVVGLDEERRPVPVRLFDGKPTRVAVVGDPYVVRVLAFRAVAMGARIRIVTARPEIWQSLSDALGTHRRLVMLVRPGTPPAAAGSLARPVLTVLDSGSLRADNRRATAAWGTVLTLLPAVSDSAMMVLRTAHLTLLQRCDHPQARRACAVLGLDPSLAPKLVYAPDDGMALVSDGEATFLRMSSTQIERGLLGG